MDEKIYQAANGVKVIYRHKSKKYDFKHVIFVFSGFLNAKPGNYDFLKALTDCPCDVVWIKDDFEEMYTYYLCIDMNFKIEQAVTEFINYQVCELGLEHKDITVTGFSKGGSAALYYGLKLNIRNIVATVPQLYVGSYVDNHWRHVAEHMMGKDYAQIHIKYIDNLLIELLKKDEDKDKNLYILTSESDIQYGKEIEPNLSEFRKYKNFNLLKSYSLFARQHNQITGHHTALLLGIYYSLASGAVPRFNETGEVNFFGTQPIALSKPSLVPYIDLRKIEIRDEKLFIDGVGLIRGVNVEEYKDIDYSLILKGKQEYTLALAKAERPNLTRELFDGELVVYDKCWFTTLHYKGLDISHILRGEYELYPLRI